MEAWGIKALGLSGYEAFGVLGWFRRSLSDKPGEALGDWSVLGFFSLLLGKDEPALQGTRI